MLADHDDRLGFIQRGHDRLDVAVVEGLSAGYVTRSKALWISDIEHGLALRIKVSNREVFKHKLDPWDQQAVEPTVGCLN